MYSFYEVRQRDQLFAILRSHYGVAKFTQDKQRIVEQVKANNPQISNIDLIVPGQVIMLPDLSLLQPQRPGQTPGLSSGIINSCSAVSSELTSMDGQTKSLMTSLDYNAIGIEAGKGFVEFVQKTTEAAVPAIEKVALKYYQQKAGTITKGQYDYGRTKLIKEIDKSIRPLRPLISPGQATNQIIRIKPNEIVRTQAILDEAKNLKRIAKVASSGLAIVKVVDLGVKAADFHTAANNQQRTVIVMDEALTWAGGAAATAVCILIVGTPVGWAAIAGVIAVSAVGGLGGQQLSKVLQEKMLFDAKGNRIETKADRFWKNFYD